MTVFVYDKTFEGLLTAVFDAYSRRSFPDLLLAEGEPFPLFYDEAVTICTDDAKVDRVWKGLQKRLSAMALSVITVTWLSFPLFFCLVIYDLIRPPSGNCDLFLSPVTGVSLQFSQ